MSINETQNSADSSHTMDTAVLIVGAGPTGLALAATLAHASIPVIVVDRAARGANTSRAAVIHARTLDVLDTIGLAQPLIDRGVIVPRFSVRHGDKVLMTIDFEHIDSPHRYTLMLPQSTTEQVIADSLPTDLPVLRSHTIGSVEQRGDGITAVVTGTDGIATEIRARWLVGCDGMHSRVRELAGIDFRGDRYPQSFLLADVRMDWPIPRTEVELFFAPTGLAVVAPLPDERFRVVATMDPDGFPPDGLPPDGLPPDGLPPEGLPAESPARDARSTQAVDLVAVQHLLEQRGPATGQPRVRELLWSSNFTVHHRLALSYRRGNVFLAGDAAHVHSPAGGQGMNLGIQDAVDLGVMLADDADGMPVDLDGYEARRRPQAERVVRLTDRMTRAATTKSHAAGVMRDLVIAAAGHIPSIQKDLAGQLSGADLHAGRGR